jgi:hypothetical protein
MGPHNLLPPPADDPKATLSRKNTSSSTPSPKPVHRVAKRTESTAGMTHNHDHASRCFGMDGRHKRIRKACERCRMKKTKVCSNELNDTQEQATSDTNPSVTMSFPANAAGMTAWYAQLVCVKRWSTSSFTKGKIAPNQRTLSTRTTLIVVSQVR